MRAQAQAFQHLASGPLRKVEVQNGEIGTGGPLLLQSLDKLNSFFPVRDDDNLAFNAMLFKGTAD
jgi:hypothetical protein